MDGQHLGDYGAHAAPSDGGRIFALNRGCGSLASLRRVLRNEFATEGAGEDALFETVEEGEGAGGLTLYQVRCSVLSFDPRRYRALFSDRRRVYDVSLQVGNADPRSCRAVYRISHIVVGHRGGKTKRDIPRVGALGINTNAEAIGLVNSSRRLT